MEELLSKFERALLRSPLDPDYIEYVCRQQLYLMQALCRHVEIPIDIIQALQEVFKIFRQPPYSTAPHAMVDSTTSVSTRTIFRRMKDFGLSVSDLYSSMTDEELDYSVRAIKDDMPTSGYRMVRVRLLSLGIRLQWHRITASMHRVDSVGILSRLARLGCVVRRTYSVQGPLSLVHIDTNHTLIR